MGRGGDLLQRQKQTNEARLTTQLSHPNIVRHYELCRTGDEYFMAMEYVHGKDLRLLLMKAREYQEWLPEEHVAYICMLLARGLEAAHTQTDHDGSSLHIVHCDSAMGLGLS